MMLRDRNAFIYLRDDNLLLGTMSGPGACVQHDWYLPVVKHTLSGITDAEIGEIVRSAWSRCREIPLHDSKELVAIHMQAVGLGKATLKKLYGNTKCISVFKKNGVIDIRATIQDRVGCFAPLPGIEVMLPENASNEAIGAAVREMLRQSQTKF